MLTNEEIDLCKLDYRTMTPAEREAFRREVVRRAHAARDAEMRANFRRIWSALPNPRGAVQAGIATLRNLWSAFLENRKRKIAVSTLMSLDDHMLKDMGLSRSEIIAAVYAEDSSRLPPGMTSGKGRDRVDLCVSRSSARARQVFTSPI
jgi:uncharacterized protein YjiS (DUF1127 family)